MGKSRVGGGERGREGREEKVNRVRGKKAVEYGREQEKGVWCVEKKGQGRRRKKSKVGGEKRVGWAEKRGKEGGETRVRWAVRKGVEWAGRKEYGRMRRKG